jgi:L-amino acid N-acyltransferase YncA
VIRFATIDDAAAVQAIYAPEVAHGTASFETEPPDVAEMARRIAATLPTWPWLVWDQHGRVLGYAYASRHREREAYRWSIDTAVYVSPDCRGRGIALGLYRRLFEITARQGFHAAFAGVATPNPASEALHRAVGFSLIGVYPEVGFKHGRWRDVGWWRRELAPAAGEPAEPIPFGRLETHDGQAR